ncbi:MAG: glycosyltransferase family 2 protein [Pseudomonadota bacterium]
MAGTVSVVLPTYNRCALIGETVESLLAQSRAPVEILIVDDGSTEDLAPVLAPFGDRIRLLRKENGGKATALNLGLSKITGDYVWICDDDDLLLEHACQSLAGALDADPNLDFVAGRFEDFRVDPATGAHIRKKPGYWRPSAPDTLFFDVLDDCHIFQPGLMARKKTYETVGPFREDLVRSQDYEMLLRLCRLQRGALLDDLVFLHRDHDAPRGSSTDRFTIEQNNARWAAYNRKIFEPLLADLRPEELLPAAIWNDPHTVDRRERRAELKRASVYARRWMWPEAVEIWTRLARFDDNPLDTYEMELVRSATLSVMGSDGLLENDAVRQCVLGLRRISPLGKEIASALGASVAWQAKRAIKARNFPEALTVARFVAKARFGAPIA